MSRPRLRPAGTSIGLCIQLSTQEYDQLQALARERKTSMAAVVRAMLHQTLADQRRAQDRFNKLMTEQLLARRKQGQL